MIIAIITTVDAPTMLRKGVKRERALELHGRNIRHAVNPFVPILYTVSRSAIALYNLDIKHHFFFSFVY